MSNIARRFKVRGMGLFGWGKPVGCSERDTLCASYVVAVKAQQTLDKKQILKPFFILPGRMRLS